MKMNFIISIICSLLLGYLCANFLLDSKNSSMSVFNDASHVYFLEYQQEEKEQKLDFPHIIVEEQEGDKIYVGMSTNIENVKKIEEEYKDLKVVLTVTEKKVDNEEFVNELSQYDILLNTTKTKEEMQSILATILSSYEEFVFNK